MYHKVDLESQTMWWVTVNNFYRQMIELSDKEIVYLDDYDQNNEKHVVITFDGIYDGVLKYAAPILQKFGYVFELFLTSDYIGKNNNFDIVEPTSNFTSKEELVKLIKYGGRLQWHTRSHINLGNIKSIDLIKQELEIPEDVKSLDKTGFNWFAYPHGEFNDLVVKEVMNKFIGAVSCHQGDNTKYKLNRLTIINDTSFRKDKIACIIASYNYGDFLIEAIESVLFQTMLPDEILISDDCSTDETQMIAKGYVDKYPNLIKYNRNKENLGIVQHFNKAINLISSEFVFFLGADNRLQSDYIEKTYQVLKSNKNIGIAYTDYSFFGDNAKLAYLKVNDKYKGRILNEEVYQINFPEFKNDSDLKSELEKGNFIHGSSMFKTKCFYDVGGYIKSENPEDYNFFKRIIDANWQAKKALTNLEYRQHSYSQANNIVIIQNKLLFYKASYEKLLFEKQILQKSKSFRITFKFINLLIFCKNNFKNPKLIASKIFKKIKKLI